MTVNVEQGNEKMRNPSIASTAGALLATFMAASAIAQEAAPTLDDVAKMSKAEKLSRYDGWVTRASGSCCFSPDANIGQKSRPTGDPVNPLEVEFTRTVDGSSPLSHPVWIAFAAGQIKTKEGEAIDQMCRVQKKADEAQGKKSTCEHPPGAFAFGLDNMKLQEGGTFYLDGHPETIYKPGDVVNADNWKLSSKYCVYPAAKPQM